MDHKAKTTFQLETPFTSMQWPELLPEHQETIQELLCRVLSPIGQYRSDNVVRSKGKRSKKRKRKQEAEVVVSDASNSPPLPEISSFVVIGLNAVVRSLESLSQTSRSQLRDGTEEASPNTESSLPPPRRHFSAIFVVSPSVPTILHEHLPQLIATASMAHPELPATRLVQLPKSSGNRLSGVLGLPRVSFIGLLENAPHSKVLIDFVREHIPEAKIPWLEEAQKATYLPLKVKAVETFAPVSKKT